MTKEEKAAYNREWYLRNKELTKQRAAEWAAAHPEERKQNVKRYHDSHSIPHRISVGRAKAKKRGHAFAVNVAEVEKARQLQNELCAICGRPERRKQNGALQALAIDHCHTSGQFRGLLCEACNKILGFVEDSGQRLQAAVAYLQQGQSGDDAPFQLDSQLY